MKFAHMADVHLGAWRDPKMRELGIEAFRQAIGTCIKEKVEFVLIAGDFYNTSLPGIDVIQESVKQLRKLTEQGIRIYIIPGSHDFSTSGKTMLNVLEEAGIVKNVCKGEVVDDKLQLKFTVDKKTGTKLTGILGRRGSLETSYYEDLDRKSLEKESGFKIFLFHSAIDELKPKKFEKIMAAPISYLPKGFDYYAGGHVHIIKDSSLPGYNHIVYPGPIFPASFSELEDLEKGGFYIYEDGNLTRKDIMVKNVVKIKLDVDHKTAEQAALDIRSKLKQEFVDSIVLLRVEGKLSSGKVSDINFKEVFQEIYDKGAYFVMKNTAKLTSEEFTEVKVTTGTPEEIEGRVLKEHAGQVKVSFPEIEMAQNLMTSLARKQDEAEKKYEYDQRVREDAEKVLEIE
ncbi:exonuclease SbcCD subunit D [Nanoarchaeota archaeon]